MHTVCTPGAIYEFLDGGGGYTLTAVGCLQPAKLGHAPQKHFEIRILNCFIFDIKVKHTQKRPSQCSRPDPQTLLALPSTHAELTFIERRRCQERILCTLDNVASFY